MLLTPFNVAKIAKNHNIGKILANPFEKIVKILLKPSLATKFIRCEENILKNKILSILFFPKILRNSNKNEKDFLRSCLPKNI